MGHKEVLLTFLPLLLSGCLGHGQLAENLNKRHIQSCIVTVGFVGPFVLRQTVTATGGADLQQCMHVYRVGVMDMAPMPQVLAPSTPP